MHDHTPPEKERDTWQLSDWTVWLALFTILVLGGVVSFTTGTPDSQVWDLADRAAVQVKAAE